MKTFVVASLLCGVLLFHCAAVAGSDDVTSAQVNGTWGYRLNTFKILALGGQKLKVEFHGEFEYKGGDGQPTANEGDGSGTATIEGRTAKFKPDGTEEGCMITLKFVGESLVVTQEGDCGFGHRVSAEGKYRKVDAHKPKFDAN